MKAKKIIAIGLVAAMTLGMSTSVFATESNPYDDYPQFNEWDTPYGSTDNVFHAKGQGWLESGVGINESVTNVIVPTTPNINIRYGQPGLFDFGFDPQRLVKRTGALKYAGKENFTNEALESGVYFINEPKLDGEHADENTYDNKSVKLKGTNIGTEPVAFTVSATLAGGQNFEYLEEDPSTAPELIKASELYQSLYNKIGATWEAFVTEANGDLEGGNYTPPIHTEANMLVLAQDIALGDDCEYRINDVRFNDEQKQAMLPLYDYSKFIDEQQHSFNAYITGSDQVWGKIALSEFDSNYFWDHLEEGEKIFGFSSSFGKITISNDLLDSFKFQLKKYNGITVREKTALNILEELGYKTGVQILDPTMMVETNLWENLATDIPYHKPYILVYQIHDNQQMGVYVKSISSKLGARILRVSNSFSHIIRNGKLVYLPTPERFLGIIKHARYVVTDSFHATVFSILFNRQFCVVNSGETNTRIESLLNSLNISSRLVQDYSDFSQLSEFINYKLVNKILQQERIRSDQVVNDIILSRI